MTEETESKGRRENLNIYRIADIENDIIVSHIFFSVKVEKMV